MSEETMVKELGANKAASKIANGKMLTRPDQDTGLEGRWDIEYKVYTDSGKVSEIHDNVRTLSVENEHSNEKGTIEALEDIQTAASCMMCIVLHSHQEKTEVIYFFLFQC